MGQSLSSLELGKNTVCALIKSMLGHSDTCWYLLIFSICCMFPADAFKLSIKKIKYFLFIKSNEPYYFLTNSDTYFFLPKMKNRHWDYQ